MSEPAARFVEVRDEGERVVWRLDTAFLASNYRCIWGQGCQGIHDERRPELFDGCCSVGVVLRDEEEAMTVAALAATTSPSIFEHAGEAVVEARSGRWATRVVDGACVFFNRAGFPGGTGCALHLAALAAGDDPLEWKPQTCGRMPLRLEETPHAEGGTEVTVRAWRRDDWGPGGASMAWWCTEEPDCYTSDEPVYRSMAPQLRSALGDAVYDQAVMALEETE